MGTAGAAHSQLPVDEAKCVQDPVLWPPVSERHGPRGGGGLPVPMLAGFSTWTPACLRAQEGKDTEGRTMSGAQARAAYFPA